MFQRQINFINAQVESSLPLGLSGAELWLYAAPRAWERHPSQALRKALFVCPAIKWERYLEFYPDVKQAGMNPYLHFIKYGRKEKRQLPSAFSEAETFPHSSNCQDSQEAIACHAHYLPDSLDEPELAKLAAEYGSARKFYEAYLCCMALYLRFGAKRDYLCLAGDQLAELGRHDHAEILYEQYLEMRGLPTTEMARHTLMGRNSTPELVKKALFRYFRLPPASIRLDVLREVMAHLSFLLRHEGNESLKYIYDNIFHTLLRAKNPKLAAENPHFISMIPVSLALACGRAPSLKTFAPVLKHLPDFVMDIVLFSKREHDMEDIRKYGITNFRILYGLNNLENYRTLICDQVFFAQIRKEFNLAKLRIIGYHHGVELEGLYAADLFLTSSANQAATAYAFPARDLAENTIASFARLPPKIIQEISVTGPYQNEPELASKCNKMQLRATLAKKYRRNIPADKPLIFVMEDGSVSLRQLVYLMNRLATYCTVIYKYVFFHSEKLLKSISPDIIIEKDIAYSPNTIKYASDFILCGPFGSTPLSSLMIGLNFIPYFSRVAQLPKTDPVQFVKYGNPKTGGHDISRFEDDTSRGRFLRIWPYFFDVLNAQAIKDAIFLPDYLKWYRANLNSLREKILGHYQLKGCAKMAAEHTLRYAATGTIGEQCSYALIK